MSEPKPEWIDANHALNVGRLLGTLMEVGIDAKPVIVDGNYTPWIDITLPDSQYLVKRTMRVHVEGPIEEAF